MSKCLLVNEATNEVVYTLGNSCGWTNLFDTLGIILFTVACVAVIGWFIWVTIRCIER